METGKPETWSIEKSGNDSLVLRDRIFAQADSFCLDKKRYLMPVERSYREKYYKLTFRCLSSGDPEYIQTKSINTEKRYHKKLGGYGELKY